MSSSSSSSTPNTPSTPITPVSQTSSGSSDSSSEKKPRRQKREREKETDLLESLRPLKIKQPKTLEQQLEEEKVFQKYEKRSTPIKRFNIKPPKYLKVEVEATQLLELVRSTDDYIFHELGFAVLRKQPIYGHFSSLSSSSSSSSKATVTNYSSYSRRFTVRFLDTDNITKSGQSLDPFLPTDDEKEFSLSVKDWYQWTTVEFMMLKKPVLTADTTWVVEFNGTKDQSDAVYWLFRCRGFYLSTVIEKQKLVSQTDEQQQIERFRFRYKFEYDSHADVTKPDTKSCLF